MATKSAKAVKVLIVLALFALRKSEALDNGLVLRPPMGFNTWERYRCTTDCTSFPNACLDENLIMQTADLMSTEYLAAGYEYLVIDDCWSSMKRDGNGDLQEDPARFPRGMKTLVDYVHSKGLKFGIYGNFGKRTCAGYPGIEHDLARDVDLFANRWAVDFVKLDGCFSTVKAKAVGYPEFGRYLNETGRQIIYSCSWPSYLVDVGIHPNYSVLSETCNMWRNYEDVEDSWHSVTDIVEFYGKQQDDISRFHGPGHWHDADMLIIGNFGLSFEQSKSQMALWCVMGVPLFMSTDLSKIGPEFKAILLNPLAIAIDQDALGFMGRRIEVNKGVQIWRRAVSPVYNEYYSYAVVIFNGRVDGSPRMVRATAHELGLYNPQGYVIQEVYQGGCRKFRPDDVISVAIPPSGVAFWKFTIIDDAASVEAICGRRIQSEINPIVTYFSILLLIGLLLAFNKTWLRVISHCCNSWNVSMRTSGNLHNKSYNI